MKVESTPASLLLSVETISVYHSEHLSKWNPQLMLVKNVLAVHLSNTKFLSQGPDGGVVSLKGKKVRCVIVLSLIWYRLIVHFVSQDFVWVLLWHLFPERQVACHFHEMIERLNLCNSTKLYFCSFYLLGLSPCKDGKTPLSGTVTQSVDEIADAVFDAVQRKQTEVVLAVDVIILQPEEERQYAPPCGPSHAHTHIHIYIYLHDI